MILTATAVAATLMTSIRQLNMQRELWVEEHRPKILIKVDEVTRSNDTIFVANTIQNYGLSVADVLSLNVFISDAKTAAERKIMTDKPTLDPDVNYDYKFLIKPEVTKKLQDIFYIEMYMDYGWHGESDHFKYNVNVRLIYDSANSKYKINVIAKSKIPKKR